MIGIETGTKELLFKAGAKNKEGKEDFLDIRIAYDTQLKIISLFLGATQYNISSIEKYKEGSTANLSYTRLLCGNLENLSIEKIISVIVNCGATPPQFGIITANTNGLLIREAFFTITHKIQDEFIDYVDNLEVPLLFNPAVLENYKDL